MTALRLWMAAWILALAAIAVCQSGESISGLESPRATLTTFFSAMNEVPADSGAAARCLDLSDIPPLVCDTQGPILATELFAVFNRTKFVILEKVPAYADGPDYVIPISIRLGGQIEDLPPIVIHKGEDGGWRIASQTVESLPRTYLRVKDLPVIGSLKDIEVAKTPLELWAEASLPAFWQQHGVLAVVNWKWPALLAALFLSYLAAVALRTTFKLLLRLKTGTFGSTLAKPTLDSAGRGVGLLAMGGLFGAFVHSLQLVVEVKAAALLMAVVLGTVGGVWVAMAAVEFAISRITHRIADNDRAERLFLPILRNLGRVAVFILAGVIFLQVIGFNVTGIIAGLGIGGIVVALAAKDSVENLFGSFTLIFEMPFQIGDWIISGDIEGTVEEISLRSTTLRTFHDSTILVPNSKFIANPVENMGRRRYRRMKTTIGITYDATPDQVESFVSRVKEYLKDHPDTWTEKTQVAFNDYGPSSLNVLLYFFIAAPDWGEELRIRQEILLEVMRIAQNTGVHFAFPTQTMILDTNKSSMRILTDE